MSLLLANGHPDALDYPLGMVSDEAELIVERQNRNLATGAILMQAAVGSTQYKEMGEVFRQLIAELSGE